MQRQLDAARSKAAQAEEHKAALGVANETLDSLRAQVAELKRYRASARF